MAAVNGNAPIAGPIPLLTPYKLGPFNLSLRIVYPPLTRSRATGTIPQPNAVTYYSQRAIPGLLMISEGTVVSPDGHGYPDTPGLYTEEQVEAWKPIVKGVHDKGAVFFAQIWHVGRESHPAFMPDGVSPPIAPSPIPLSQEETIWTPKGPQKPVVPREMTAEDIQRVVNDFRTAARNARRAGFDGVEIHGANGYLLDQFLKDGPNKRTDAYGGPIENRARFTLEVVKAVVDEIGRDRVGLRLSPFGGFLEVTDTDPYATNNYLIERLNEDGGLAYLHFVEPRVGGSGDREPSPDQSIEPFRKTWKGTFIAAGGYKRDSGNEAITSGHADLVAYGRLFLSNPDLPKRFELDAPLNKYDRNTFYVNEPVKGYIDYPYLDGTTQIPS